MDPVVAGVFCFVYLGMILGEIPGLALDRTGIALLGAIVLVATNRITADAAWRAIDVPTIALLFGLMVVSAQFRLGGFYAAVVRRIDRSDHAPGVLLALVILTAAVLSAVLANDIVCLAMAPMLIEACARRRLDPIPFLLALACAANVGSAATLIGNPQNMLIGQTLELSFAGYLRDGGIPALAGLAVVWLGVWVGYRRRWAGSMTVPVVDDPVVGPASAKATAVRRSLGEGGRVANVEGPRRRRGADDRVHRRAVAARAGGARRSRRPAREPEDGVPRDARVR